MSRYLCQVVFIFVINTLSFVKAILATQFDAFDKGRWHVRHMAEKLLMNYILRAYVALPIQVIVGRRSIQC